MVRAPDPRLISVVVKNEESIMFVFIILEIILWIIFPVFARYCMAVKKPGCNLPFKFVPFLVFAIATIGAIVNLVSFVVLYRAKNGILAYKVIMFVLSAGFIVRMCLGLTMSVEDKR